MGYSFLAPQAYRSGMAKGTAFQAILTIGFARRLPSPG
jgi:hypothetical protein